jgi:hypothetical protein
VEKAFFILLNELVEKAFFILLNELVEKAFFMLLNELSNVILNHFHLKVPMAVGVSDIPRCINDIPNVTVDPGSNPDHKYAWRRDRQICKWKE